MKGAAEKLYTKYHSSHSELPMYKRLFEMGGNIYRILSFSDIRKRVYHDETFIHRNNFYRTEGESIFYNL